MISRLQRVIQPWTLPVVLQVVLLLTILHGSTLAQRPAPDAQRTYASAVQLYDQKLYAEAVTAFEAFRAAYPNHVLEAQALYFEARSALAQDQERTAVRLFERFERNHPNHPRAAEARLQLAQYFLDTGQPDVARNQLTAIVEAPSSPEQAARSLYLLGQSERDRGNLDTALTHFETVRSDYPNTKVAPAAFYALGSIHLRRQQYDEAASAFEALGEEYPESPFSRNLGTALAEVYYRLEEYENAADELRSRLNGLDGSTRARALFLLGEVSNHLRRGEDAVVHYRQVIDEHPESVYVGPARYGLAWHYHRAEESGQAANGFARVREANYGTLSEKAAYYEAVNRSLAGAPERAIELYQTVAEQQSGRRAEEALFEAGLLRYQQQNYKSAAAFFRALIRDHPEADRVGDAYFWLGNAYLGTNRLERALQAYRQAERREAAPDSLLREARFQKAWAQYENDRFEEAASEFLALAESHPESRRGHEALFWGADSHFQLGNLSRARALFQQYLNAHANGPHADGARYALAWTYFKQNQYETAARLFRQFLEGYQGTDSDIPYEQDARLRLADCYFALKRYDDAIEAYRRVGDPGAEYATYQTGEALYYAGRTEEALRTLRRYVDQSPGSNWHPQALYRLATVLFQEQDYDEAREYYRAFLNQHPDHPLAPEIQYGIGDSYYNAGDMENAVAAYRRVLENYPSTTTADEAASGLFFALSAADQDARAEDIIAEIGQNSPDTNLEDRLRFHRAKAAYQTGDADKSLNLFRDFIRTTSTESLLAQSYYYMGLLYADRDATTEAKNYLQQLVNEHPDTEVSAEGALRLGDMYLEEEAYENAAETYGRAAQSDHISTELRAQALYGRSMALLQLDRNDEAQTLLEELLEGSQGGPLQAAAQLGLGRIHEKENRPEEALRLYQSVVESTDSETGAEALYRWGRLLREQEDPRGAIEELDRMSSLFRGHPDWIARSLLEQARAYRQLNQSGQAARLYDEVIQSYPSTPFARTAKSERQAL